MGGQVAQSLTEEDLLKCVPGLILTGERPSFTLSRLGGRHRKLHGLSPNSKTESRPAFETVAPCPNGAKVGVVPGSRMTLGVKVATPGVPKQTQGCNFVAY